LNDLFEAICQELLSPADLTRTLETDGVLRKSVIFRWTLFA